MITRRKFIRRSATAAALSIAACKRQPESPHDKVEAILPPGLKKKGLGQSVKTPGWAKRLSDLRCKWLYSWGYAIPEGLPQGMEFIPMIRSKSVQAQRIAGVAEQSKHHGITELLGLNEPDTKNQDDITVAQALDAWPALMKSGMRLGSPGCVHPDKEWMIEFMAGVKQRKLKVDFVCVHSYGGPSAEGLIKRLEKIHQMFERPIWITEFAVGDWEAKSVEQNRHQPDAVLRFMEKVIPMLNKLDFVERYAWFPAKPTSIPLGTSALFDAEGALTRLGECYRDA